MRLAVSSAGICQYAPNLRPVLRVSSTQSACAADPFSARALSPTSSPASASTAEYILTNLEDENARHGMLCEGPLASVLPNDSAYIACCPWQVALVVPFACSNLRWGIGIRPQQTGVYVPRRLSHVSGPVRRWPRVGTPATPWAGAPDRSLTPNAGPGPAGHPDTVAGSGDRPGGRDRADAGAAARAAGGGAGGRPRSTWTPLT